jgi:hypothetical protein
MGYPDQPSSPGPEQPPPPPGGGPQPGGYPGYQPGPPGYQAPGYQAPGYQAPGYQGYSYQGPGYPVTKTNSLAVAALVCGIGQIIFGLLTGIPAIILGHMARRRIAQTGEQGAGMAMAGLVLGYIGVGLAVIVIIVLIGVAASVHST